MTPAKWYARQRARYALATAERDRAAGRIDAAVAAFDEAARRDRKYRRQALEAAASLLIEHKRPADAAQRLQGLVEIDRKDVKSWRRLARALSETGERNAAIKAWRRVMDADPKDIEANRALTVLMPEGAPETIEPLRVVAEGSPGEPKAWRRLARLLEQHGQVEPAVSAWRLALEADPKDIQAHERLAQLLEGLGRPIETLPHLRTLAALDPKKPKPLKRVARRLEELGQGAEAFATWRQVLSLDPGDKHAHERLTDLLLAQGLKARAVVHMRALAQAGGKDRSAWRRLAQTLMEIARNDEAVEAWRRLLEVDPKDLEAHRALAELQQADPMQAAIHLRALSEATPKKAEVWKRLGQALMLIEDSAGAVEAFRRVLKLDAADMEAHAALAGLLAGRKSEALPHLRALAEGGPDRADAGRKLALVLEKTGDGDGAIRALEAVLALDGDDPGVRDKVAQLLLAQGRTHEAGVYLRWLAERSPEQDKPWRRLAQTLTDGGDLEGALEVWRRLSRLRPDDLALHDRIARLLEDHGRDAEAAAHVRAIAEAAPDRPKSWKRLARLHEASGAREAAVEAWTRCAVLEPGDLAARDRLGQLLWDLGRPAEAAPHLRLLAEGEDYRPKAWRRLIACLQAAGDGPAEAEAWRRVLAYDPADLAPRERLAELLPALGRPAEAAPHLHALAEGEDYRPKAWKRLIACLRAAGDGAQEVEAWRRVLAYDPADIAAHERLVGLLSELRRPAETLPHLRALAQIQPYRPKAWRRYIDGLMATGDGAAEAEAWRLVLAQDPNDGVAHERLARLSEDLGRPADAARHLRILAEGETYRPKAWRRLIACLQAAGDGAGEVEAWGRVLAYDPGDGAAHERLVELLLELRRPAETLPHLRALAQSQPYKPKVWRRYIALLQATGDGAAEAEAWRLALAQDPNDNEAHERLAKLSEDLGRPADAARHLRILAEGETYRPKAWRRLIACLQAAGDGAGEVEAWGRVLAYDPGDGAARERMVELLSELHRPAETLPHLRALAQSQPYKPKVWRRYVALLQASGDGAAEAEAWRLVLDQDPNDGPAHERLAELLGGLGRPAEAAVHLRALAEADPQRIKAWKRLATGWRDAGHGAQEAEAWRRVLDVDAADLQAHERLAELLPDLGRSDEAAPHLLVLAEAEPHKPKAWRRLIACVQASGDREAEVHAWARFLDHGGADRQAQDRMAELLSSLGRPAEAAVHLQALAEADPEKARGWKRLALGWQVAADAAAEAQAWRRALEIDPADRQAHERLIELATEAGRAEDAAPHLLALAEAEPGKVKAWKRLALGLQDCKDAAAEADAWRRVLALDETDLQAHERLAILLADAGQPDDALAHLRAIVRIVPENSKAWRRYVRALKQAGRVQDDVASWREILALAGQPELGALLKQAEETGRRVQELKQALSAAGAEAKLQRAGVQHAQARLEREERAHRAAQGLLKDEIAERRRLTAELQESRQRRLQAEAEESSHLLTARLLGLMEPAGAEDRSRRDPQGDTAAYVHSALSAAAASGAVIAGRPEALGAAGLEVTLPDGLDARLRRKSSRVVVLADEDEAAAADARARLEGKRGLQVLDRAQLLIRAAAGMTELKAKVEPVSEDVWPNRPVMVIASDDRLRSAVVAAIRLATDAAFAPLFPAALADEVKRRALDLDDWLAAAWSAAGRPRVFGFEFDPDALALFAHAVRSGRAPVMAKVFRRATALQLAWSDKALHAAEDYARRAGELAAGFDAGDAQMEVKSYKRLIHRDVMMESALDQLGKFKPATVKAYRELFDKPALGRFCRDAGLALSVAGFAEVEEAALGFSPAPALAQMGALIGEAVRSLTAAREPETPPAGLIEFGLGRSLEALGRHAEALAAYQDAVARAPTYFPARGAAARHLELSGHADAAERLLRRGLGNGTPDADVQEGLLSFYQRNGLPLGVAAVSRLMRRRGQSRPAIAAPALIELGRYREAEPLLNSLGARLAGQDTFLADLLDIPDLAARLPELTAAADADPHDGAAQFRLAEALRRLGRLPEALEPYRRALGTPGVLEAELGIQARRLPQFLMVGPPRTGTTLLRRLFDLHPQIAAPPGELFFFSNRSGQRAGSNRQRAPLAWYLKAFAEAAEAKPGARLLGEKTPHYFSMPDEQMAFARLLSPELKIIVTLRDPVVRAWSEIKVQRRITEAEIVAALSRGEHPAWFEEVLGAGRYVAHLRRWLSHFAADRVLLIDADALETNVVDEAQRLFRWLGVRELGQRQVTALQQGWNNRTEAFTPSETVADLLRRCYAGEPWKAEDVSRALGLGDAAPAAANEEAPSPPARRSRAAAK